MMDPAERALLEDTIRAALADAGTSADTVLAGLGWLEMLDTEPRDAVDIVFETLGATNRAATALDDVLAGALGRKPGPDLAVLLPPFGAWDPPAHISDGHARALGLATARVATARNLLIVGHTGSGPVAATVPVASIDVCAVRGIDPDAGFHTVRVDHSPVVDQVGDPAAWEAAVALGRRATARQIAGATRAMLSLARTHALERVQFGRPIASFQAVRHRLANTLLAIEALEATLAAAGDEPNPLTAALAKATAGYAARTVATNCQQVLAGIGFTTDHPFHRFLKRTMVLEGLFGSGEEITLAIGRELIAERRVPTLIEL
ncbi:MAG TPA: acyl-CoA dehydrogenase family protein [Acidimicrobiia bacterium]|nr:acyl-CoA dehydrogenase family protein [Acidimicrobiia bacterium]